MIRWDLFEHERQDGQYSIEVGDYLAIQMNAAPPLAIDTTQTAVDMTAYLNQAPNGGAVVVQVYEGTTLYGALTIPKQRPAVEHGYGPEKLTKGARFSINITNVPTAWGTLPGMDLTASIRL